MKLIDLGEDREKAEHRFNILYATAFAGTAERSLNDSRSLGKIQDKLEAISDEVPVEKRKPGESTRFLTVDVSSLTLDDVEVELLLKRPFTAGIEWSALASRRLTDTIAMLEKAESYTPPKPLVSVGPD